MTGQRLLHYEIVGKVGEGGMGVVYKARDTHLDRFVAIKVLPPERVADPARKARFVQEAKAASALNHPNIVVVHDIVRDGGADFMVMEYVAGKTLERLIPRKGMRLTDALKIAVQVADALSHAHTAGIIHRDLKPSNIMVDEHGFAKVLDFGLAKLTERAAAEDATTATMAVRTDEGIIAGTAAYMSPEQAEANPVDARSDIFSLGAVLYEMVTGHRAFTGASKISTLSAVLHQEPAPLPDNIPHDLGKLIARCLRKDPGKRFQHAADLKVALEELKDESESDSLTAPARIRGRNRRRVLAALIAGAACAGGWWMWKTLSPREPYGTLRETPFTADPGFEMYPSFSPDGLSVVYQKMPPAEQWGPDSPAASVMVKMIGSESTAVLKENAISPVWSPDGRWIAFGRRRNWFLASETAVLVMPRIGGTERKIADVSQGLATGSFVAWTPDSKGLITTDRERPGAPFHLVLLSLDGDEKKSLTSPPPIVLGDVGPALSPDGKTLAFCRRTSGSAGDLYLLALDANNGAAAPPRKLETGLPLSNWPVWTRDGREIVFCSGVWAYSTLWRIRADGSGASRRLPFGGQGAFQPALAAAGDRLAYIKHTWDTDIWRIELLPSGLPAGAPEKFLASSRADYGPAWSPDGRSIAFVSQRAGRSQIWVCDSNGAGPHQLTAMESSLGMEPVWSPDSQWIAFTADTAGDQDIYVVGLRGGAPRRLTAGPAADYLPQWSADARYVYFLSNRSGENRVWKVAREGGNAIPESDPGSVRGYSLRSQDGRFSIWREPIGPGNPVMVVDGVAERGFAVAGKGIYYVPRGPESNPWYTGIAFFDFAAGRSLKVADLKPHLGIWAGTSPCVSPDGRYLLFTQYSAETNDLMMVENFR